VALGTALAVLAGGLRVGLAAPPPDAGDNPDADSTAPPKPSDPSPPAPPAGSDAPAAPPGPVPLTNGTPPPPERIPPKDRQIPRDQGPATAPPGPPVEAADRVPDQRTAKDATGAPVPGQESGIVAGGDSGPGFWRRTGRIVLWPFKMIDEGVLYLPYGGVYLFDRYRLDKLYYKLFFNSNKTIGLVPTGTYESGYGVVYGLSFVASNVFKQKERFAVTAETGAGLGDSYRAVLGAEAHSGNAISPYLELGLLGTFERRPKDPFWGIGNGDAVKTPPPVLIDPRNDQTEYETYFRTQEARAAVTADIKPSPIWHIALTGALTDIRYGESHYPPTLGDVYNAPVVPGFVDGVEHAYTELEVRWDTRRRVTQWEAPVPWAAGSLVAAYVGRINRLDGGQDYYRWGGELQHFFRLGRGPRVLIARLHAAGVTGSLDAVPFTELPFLGGGDYLRGYSFERFRDRVAAFGSLQYEWDLSHFLAAYVFTDFGRVYHSVENLTAADLRVGYGVGLDIHGEDGLIMTASVASSIDGGLMLTLSFNPAFDARPRWR
jgi:hypothetical protein